LLQEVSVIDAGRFQPGRAVDALNNIVRGLATDFAPNETADVDLLELNHQWDENVRTGQTMLVPTGIRVLDQALGGGTPRNLWGLQGKPGSGKNMIFTTMAKSKLLVDHHGERRTKLGIVGLENGTAWLTRRWQAEDLGLAQKEIGSKKLSPEEAQHKAQVDQRHFELLNRIHVYRYGGAGIGEVVRRIMRWVFDEGVTEVLVDNLREFKQQGEYVAHIDARHHLSARSRRQVRHPDRPRDPRHGGRAEGQGSPRRTPTT
jgi:replicative DNA helicase